MVGSGQIGTPQSGVRRGQFIDCPRLSMNQAAPVSMGFVGHCEGASL